MLLKTLAMAFGWMLVACTFASAASTEPAAGTEGKVLFRKPIGSGEVVCSAGPFIDPSLLAELAGKQEEMYQAAAYYELRVDWLVPGRPPMRLWSRLARIGKWANVNELYQPIKPSVPLARQMIEVLDLAITPPNDFTGAHMVLATRSWGGGFGLIDQTIGGGFTRVCAPRTSEWSQYGGNRVGDVDSVRLSVAPDGRCRAEVTSGPRHTIYLQDGQKWEFTIEKQWRDEPAPQPGTDKGTGHGDTPRSDKQ